MQSRARSARTAFAALLMLGSILAATASAGPGPFWYQRQVKTTGSGVKISEKAPVKFEIHGGVLELVGRIGEFQIVVRCDKNTSSGILYNNELQGQLKINTIYESCVVNELGFEHCKVVEPVVFKTHGYLEWKYRGKEEELGKGKQVKARTLGQLPYLLFYSGPIKRGTTSINEETELFTVNLESTEGEVCGQAGMPLVVRGAQTASVTPFSEQFGSTITIGAFYFLLHQQHFWNGLEQVPLSASPLGFTLLAQDGLTSFVGEKNEQQEVAVVEG